MVKKHRIDGLKLNSASETYGGRAAPDPLEKLTGSVPPPICYGCVDTIGCRPIYNVVIWR